MVTGAHGLLGIVRIKSFTTDPRHVAAYGPVSDFTGSRNFHLTLTGDAKGVVLARIKGVKDRDEAQALAGTELFVDRHLLPETAEDEFYYADLVGLAVKNLGGEPYGTVHAVHNFGAGDVLEIERVTGGRVMLPFSRETVPEVDLEAGLLVVDPPPGLESDASKKQ
jgi:16S rRNA processing protein RimM